MANVLFDQIARELKGLRNALDTRPTLRLGTVTAVAPLRVHLDGDTAPLPASPRSLVPVGPGDRVTVAHQKRTVTILGTIATAGTPWRQAVGRLEVVGTGASTAGGTAPLPAGRFTLAPEIFPTPQSSVYLAYPAGGTTRDQVGVGVRRYDSAPIEAGVTVTVSWLAVQMTPTSAGD